MAPISQREARRLQKRVAYLKSVIEGQRNRWQQTYIGHEIYRVTMDSTSHAPTAIRTARKLAHAVVAICDENDQNTIRFVALPHPSEEIK